MDGIHQSKIYDLGLVVTTVVLSLGISIPADFFVTPSENSSSLESHICIFKIFNRVVYWIHYHNT